MQSGHIVFRFVFLDDGLIICQRFIIAAHTVLTLALVEMGLRHEGTVRELAYVILASGNGGFAVAAVVFGLRRLERDGILTIGGDVHVLGTHIVEKLAGIAVFRVNCLQIGERVLGLLRTRVGLHHVLVSGNGHLRVVAVQVGLCQTCVRLADILALRMALDKILISGNGT